MKKAISAFVIAAALPVLGFAEDVKLVSVYGTVEYRVNQNSAWQKAEKGTMVPEGGAVKSGEDGSALLEMENKSRIWLKQDTALEIEQKQSLITRLALVFGRIKVRVPHLRRKEKFDLRTPTAVCAVRGTELIMESDMEGRMNLQVLFGEVKMRYAITPQKGDNEITITQGQFLKIEEKDKPGVKALMDKKQELAGLQKWDPGLSDNDRVADIKRKELDRVQIRDFSRQTQNTENMVKSFTYKGRESDLEAGRTLKDVHGNVVRVDQRLVRPDGETLQFYNLVKRANYADYTYTNAEAQTYGFKYNGIGESNRLDLLIFTMGFNKALPQSISDWPGFFDGDDVHAEQASFVFANKTDPDNIFFTAQGYKYDEGKDELMNDRRIIGSSGGNDILLTGVIDVSDLGNIVNLNVKDAGSGDLETDSDVATPITGAFWAEKTDVSSYEWTGSDAGDDLLYQFRADQYAVGGDPGDVFWLAQENYVISNSGGIKKITDFTKSSSDPFSILKESAVESIIYLKQDSAGSIDKTTDYFLSGNRNIDLVIIPDLAIAGIQKVMSAIDSLNQ